AVKELRLGDEDLKNDRGVRQLWDALKLTEILGVSVETAVDWSGIVDIGRTARERFDIAHSVKEAVKSRYTTTAWQTVAAPIFDKLRQRQRDALVAWVLHNHPEGFENANQLFEYFLIDPGMEPVVQTSRIRLALSSVQLFIQRCLLNLEPNVSPAAIDAAQWQWMKNYRVWEANRKIFLFPENWLEPEFRDDKTHLFQEVETALIRGDVSNDVAEEAFYRYLRGLESIANLEIVTLYIEKDVEERSVQEPKTAHVIARTHNLPQKYFYRRSCNQSWTIWEPVSAEI